MWDHSPTIDWDWKNSSASSGKYKSRYQWGYINKQKKIVTKKMQWKKAEATIVIKHMKSREYNKISTRLKFLVCVSKRM